MEKQTVSNVDRNINSVLTTVSFLLILSAPGVLIYQGYMWLRFGNWIPLQLHTVLSHFNIPFPASDWIGIQKIINLILALPISGTFFFMGILGFYLLDWAID